MKLGDAVTYERRDNYWDKDAQLAKTITIQGMTDDNARLNALKSGQLDISYTMVTGYDQASRSVPVTNSSPTRSPTHTRSISTPHVLESTTKKYVKH